MLPYISLSDNEFKPLVSHLKTIFHGKYFSAPDEWRLVLLCGKSLPSIATSSASLSARLFNLLNIRNKLSSKPSLTNREVLLKYAQGSANKQKFFFAEKILHKDFDESGLDLLRGEKYLADIVDCIFIFLESWGTAAELGAFAINNNLCEKLLVVNDIQYKQNNSFISKGPLKLVDRGSTFCETYYCDTSNIVENLPEIEKIISSAKSKKTPRVHLPIDSYTRQTPKAWLFLICDLLRMIQPIDIISFHFIVKEIIGNIRTDDFYAILNIAILIELITQKRYGGQKLFYVGEDIAASKPFLKIKEKDISLSRIMMSEILQNHFPDFYERWKKEI